MQAGVGDGIIPQSIVSWAPAWRPCSPGPTGPNWATHVWTPLILTLPSHLNRRWASRWLRLNPVGLGGLTTGEGSHPAPRPKSTPKGKGFHLARQTRVRLFGSSSRSHRTISSPPPDLGPSPPIELVSAHRFLGSASMNNLLSVILFSFCPSFQPFQILQCGIDWSPRKVGFCPGAVLIMEQGLT